MKPIRTGAEVLADEHADLLDGKRVGVITNHTSTIRRTDGSSEHLVDFLNRQPGIEVKVLFSPEHGIRGDIPPGQHVEHGIDERTGIPIYSLYGKCKKPTPDMLEEVDVLIYDIQDVGVRFYTFITTLIYTMEAAAERGIRYIVLDRPNMVSNRVIDGPLLDNGLRSFVGALPIPIVYGMTPGELASMANREKWLTGGMTVDLDVVPVEYYRRGLWFDQTGLAWVNPSPNVRSMDAVITYPGIALLEGTNISEGRGTDTPFLVVGAPFVDGTMLEEFLHSTGPIGVFFQKTVFTPQTGYHLRGAPKYSNMRCEGVTIGIADREKVQPVELGLSIITAIHKLYPGKVRFREPWFDRLVGSDSVRSLILKGLSAGEIASLWREKNILFKASSEKYYLYNDFAAVSN
jgi:uncharacterized protein YbbC (DUF1343 family)